MKGRLLVAHGGSGDASQFVEVAHEALIRGWKRLARWLERDREFLLWRKRLQARMETGAHLTGAALGDATRWRKTHDADLSAEERAFVEASVRRRRTRTALGVAAVVVVGAIAWGAVLFGQRVSSWELLGDHLRNQQYGAAFALLRDMRVGERDVARLQTLFRDELKGPAELFSKGVSGLEANRAGSTTVLTVVRATVPALGERAKDLKVIGAMAWALDYFPGRDPDLAARAEALRDELLAPLRATRPPPRVDDLEWVDLEGGSFEMGSAEGEGYEEERPRHTVTVSRFRILSHEVTVREYRKLVPAHLEQYRVDETWPAFNVNWYEAYAYAAWLDCRLPTEAEWEYAARAKCGFDYCDRDGNSTTLDAVGWYGGNSGPTPRPVKTREPSPSGLYDMYGNVWEWVADWKADYRPERQSNPWGPPGGDFRPLRGGSWNNNANLARAAIRSLPPPDLRNNNVGFRVVRSSLNSVKP